MMPTISKCPVCGSTNLEQQYRYLEPWRTHRDDTRVKDGSYCRDCGACNVFNVE